MIFAERDIFKTAIKLQSIKLYVVIPNESTTHSCSETYKQAKHVLLRGSYRKSPEDVQHRWRETLNEMIRAAEDVRDTFHELNVKCFKDLQFQTDSIEVVMTQINEMLTGDSL